MCLKPRQKVLSEIYYTSGEPFCQVMIERKNIMNETMKLLFNALMDEETFATPDTELEWSNILKLSGVAKDFKIESAIFESIGKLFHITCA